MRELKSKRTDPHSPVQARPDSAPEDLMAHRRWRRRLRFFQIGLLVFFLAVSLRLVQIQIVESEKFVKLAERQYRRVNITPALRGSLLDRHGRPIATSTPYLTIEANPRNVGSDDTALAKSLSKITGKPWRRYLAQLNIEDVGRGRRPRRRPQAPALREAQRPEEAQGAGSTQEGDAPGDEGRPVGEGAA